MNYLFSIIMPVYNVESFVGEAIESVTNQTYKNFELIVVNDGSTDNSAEILKHYEKEDDRIRVLTQENQGLSAARNVGMEYANGDYIYFMDSDDMIVAEALEVINRNIRDSEVDVFAFNGKVMNESQSKKYDEYLDRRIDEDIFPMNGNDFLEYIVSTNSYIAPVWLYVIRNNFLDTIDLIFEDVKFYEDNIFTSVLLSEANTVQYINNELYLYRVREQSLTKVKKVHKRCLDMLTGIEVLLRKGIKENNHILKIISKRLILDLKILLLKRESDKEDEYDDIVQRTERLIRKFGFIDRLSMRYPLINKKYYKIKKKVNELLKI